MRTFRRVRLGVYATDDWRFVLERKGRQWRLLERGRLLARKPLVLRTSRSGNNSARDAVRWAHDVIRGNVVPISVPEATL